MSKLQEKPSALKRKQSAFQKMKFFNFFLFLWVIFTLLDPYPDPQHCLYMYRTLFYFSREGNSSFGIAHVDRNQDRPWFNLAATAAGGEEGHHQEEGEELEGHHHHQAPDLEFHPGRARQAALSSQTISVRVTPKIWPCMQYLPTEKYLGLILICWVRHS
jgi:hypothetical protein